MTVDTTLPLIVARATAPATGLFGSGKPELQVALPHAAATNASEPESTQRKSFSDLFRADLHAA